MKSQIRTHLASLAVVVLLAASLAPASAASYLVDFGTSASFRGVSVANPDPNGKYWNEFKPGDFLANMLDTTGSITPVSLFFTTSMGTDSYNGPAGPTSNPPTTGELANTTFDAVALGSLGATNAVVDYLVATAGNTVKFTLENLNPARVYTLRLFGSRKYPGGEVAGNNATRTTVYSATTSNSVVIASTNLIVGVFGDHNSNTVATLSSLVPDAQNRIYVEFRGLTSTNAGYLNALLVDETTPVPQVTANETILIDLGNDSSFNGASVVNPDNNGFYWNSVWSGAFYSNLIDVSNSVTAVKFGFDAVTGTDNFNGPAGAVNSVALGLLGGAANAVNDYYVSSRFQLQGLNPARTYKLTFFGSHKYNATNTTVYSIYTDSGYSNLVASASLVVGVGANHNSNSVAVISNLVPQTANALYVKFEGEGGANGYLNALLVEGFNPAPPPPVVETILLDFGNNSSYRGVSVSNPDQNGKYWNSVWSGAFYSNMINSTNGATLVDLGFDVAPASDSFNGPAGAVVNNPPLASEIANTVFDATALGDLGVTNAVMDYYVSASFQIQNLRPTRTYKLTFFGSHKFSTDDATVYSVYANSGYTNLVASTSLNVQTPGSPWLHNTNTVAVITNLTPQFANILYVKFLGSNGNAGYLNAMKIEGYAGTSPYAQWVENYPTIIGGPNEDPDGDGLTNLREFAFGGTPTNAASLGNIPFYRVVNTGGSNVLEYVYAQRTPPSGLTYVLETSTNLANPTGWTNTGYSVFGVGPLSPGFESVTNRIPMNQPQKFIRLTVTQP